MFKLVVILAIIAVCSAQPTTRIVNGTAVYDGEFPFMVSLRDKTGVHMCGASVIDFHWILTAAHCLNGMKAQDMSIQYGVTHVSKDGPNVARISEMFIHPKFDEENTYFADIALLKLEIPLPFSRMVRPVPLPSTRELTAGGAPATVLGWGFNAAPLPN
ncbi:trypsin-7-like [Ctenocephalides felis]|uniref:trypsin-7-like n=1 Tax=Ctenocephalides felis TaxID=7515 RepID=UPI000E6E3174|nr:trypsin-7-like [Ctenocephalides felis]